MVEVNGKFIIDDVFLNVAIKNLLSNISDKIIDELPKLVTKDNIIEINNCE